MLNMLPKLELVPISRYFITLGHARGGTCGYPGVIWTQRPHEFYRLWSGHEALPLAPASDTGLEREDALVPLVVPHTFRFTGLSFLAMRQGRSVREHPD